MHGLEPTVHLGDTIYEPDRGERYDVILTNPRFGTKKAMPSVLAKAFRGETA